jgi:dihydrofolate reductase
VIVSDTNLKELQMGRIVVSENVSVDGVMQDPTGDDGFKLGGWFNQMSAADRDEWTKVEFQEALDTEAWLIGRRTYSWFAERWSTRPGEWADRLRDIPKYIVSATLQAATEWTNSMVLKGDVIDAASTLKRQVHGDILVYGSGSLVPTLMEHDLVDELRLMIHPVVLGTGTQPFRESSAPQPMRLVGSRTVGASLAQLIYQPARAAG